MWSQREGHICWNSGLLGQGPYHLLAWEWYVHQVVREGLRPWVWKELYNTAFPSVLRGFTFDSVKWFRVHGLSSCLSHLCPQWLRNRPGYVGVLAQIICTWWFVEAFGISSGEWSVGVGEKLYQNYQLPVPPHFLPTPHPCCALWLCGDWEAWHLRFACHRWYRCFCTPPPAEQHFLRNSCKN